MEPVKSTNSNDNKQDTDTEKTKCSTAGEKNSPICSRKQNEPKKRKYLRPVSSIRCKPVIVLVTGVCFLVAGILALVYLHALIDGYVLQKLPLRDGADSFKLWQKPPVTPLVKIYFFSVTNPDAFLNRGEKPVLKEMGPYTYRETREKVDVTWYSNSSLSYVQKRTMFFAADLSVGDEDDLVTLPNVPMVSSFASAKHMPLRSQRALASFMQVMNFSLFVTHTVREMLWGYPEQLMELARATKPNVQLPEDNLFGLFLGKNDTAKDVYTIFTGEDSIDHIGHIYHINGGKFLNFWANHANHCNLVKGTDGSTFHPGLQKTDLLYLYSIEMCRALPLVFEKEVVHEGLDGYRFVPPADVFADTEPKPADLCYCEGGLPCPGGGVLNISACKFGVPILISWPHFYQADSKYQNAVIGLHPEEQKHSFFMDLLPKLGKVLYVMARMQINLAVQRVKAIEQVKDIKDTVFPLIWIENEVKGTEGELLGLLKTAVEMPPLVSNVISILLLIIGCILILCVLTTRLTQKFGLKIFTSTEKPGKRNKVKNARTVHESTKQVQPDVERSNGGEQKLGTTDAPGKIPDAGGTVQICVHCRRSISADDQNVINKERKDKSVFTKHEDMNSHEQENG